MRRKTKRIKEKCPFYYRNNDKAPDYKSIICRACSFTLGFSGYIDKFWLSEKTYNAFYINTYCGGDIKYARDSYVKNKCKGDFKECRYYKKKLGTK